MTATDRSAGGHWSPTTGATAAFAVNAASFLADAVRCHHDQARHLTLIAGRRARYERPAYVWQPRPCGTPLLRSPDRDAGVVHHAVSVPTLIRDRAFGGGPSLIARAHGGYAAAWQGGLMARPQRARPDGHCTGGKR